jgi:Zn finger protein HypA/HybF involved in hydrogenase expression
MSGLVDDVEYDFSLEELERPARCPHCEGGIVRVEGGRVYHCPDCTGQPEEECNE